MIKRISLRCPLNSTSLGNVSYNLLKSLYKKGVEVSLLPVLQKADFSSYDSMDAKFREWVSKSINDRFDTIDRKNPFVNLWHINGSDSKVADKNLLYTFYETSEPTPQEVNLVNLYDSTCFSSRYSAELFTNSGAKNCRAIPLGFDDDLFPTNKTYLKDKVHFGLMGKWEKRKHTGKLIQCWAKAYGNNFDFQLTCCVNNKFLSQEETSQLKNQALMGREFGNINFLPWLEHNSQVNDYLNSIDIDLGGMSGAEGWNLPAFNSTCLGKWPIVLNATSHKDWATESNAILVNPSSKTEINDGKFFLNGSGFNQGEMYDFKEEDLFNAMDMAVRKVLSKEPNKEGIKLKEKFSYDNTVQQILNKLMEIA